MNSLDNSRMVREDDSTIRYVHCAFLFLEVDCLLCTLADIA